MFPPAVVKQQAKLGVSAEESKAQRLKRQQARFRDRGGAFIPSTTNPLVDILLARTVSGESPSKIHPTNVTAKRFSPSKARQASPMHKACTATTTRKSQPVAGSSKSKPRASRKGKAKAVESEAEPVTRPPPKRRATAKVKKIVLDSDMEQPPPANTKSRSTLKGKGKQRAAPSTSNGNQKARPQAKTKSNPPKEVIEVFVSDDDQTLVEVPHRAKSNPKRSIRYEDDGETDDDVPIVKKRAMPHAGGPKTFGTKTTACVVTEGITSTGSSGKVTVEDEEERVQDANCPKTTRKRLVSLDKDEDVAAPPAKKGKAANVTSTKPKTAARPTKNIEKGKSLKMASEKKGTDKVKRPKDVVEPVECVSNPKKRKEEDNDDDRPQKVVKFSEPGPSYSSSRKLKENQSDKKHERTVKSSTKDEQDAPRPKLAIKLPSRAKTSKGPPREVLERIRASAARHLQCVDSEPDELDCLS